MEPIKKRRGRPPKDKSAVRDLNQDMKDHKEVNKKENEKENDP